MKQSEISSIFFDVYNGFDNIMTPNLVELGSCGDFVYEISSGRGLALKGLSQMEEGSNTIYGVTILEHNGGDDSRRTALGIYGKRFDLSGCHSTLGEAKEAISSLS